MGCLADGEVFPGKRFKSNAVCAVKLNKEPIGCIQIETQLQQKVSNL